MKVWLVRQSVRDRYYNEDQEILKFDNQDRALNHVGSVAKGDTEGITIDSIHSVDFGYSPPQVRQLELVLEDFKLALREKS